MPSTQLLMLIVSKLGFSTNVNMRVRISIRIESNIITMSSTIISMRIIIIKIIYNIQCVIFSSY